jgi:RimJ/RimL family protein N-acetyltransferase
MLYFLYENGIKILLNPADNQLLLFQSTLCIYILKYDKLFMIVFSEVCIMSIILQMTKDFALDISNWTYEAPYSIYSFQNDDETISELLKGDYYAYINLQNELIGYFCFGKPAQIPTVQPEAYAEDALDIGLGIKPTLCGKGLGLKFLNAGIEFAENNFKPNKYRLTVASFNKRAIHLYGKAGFVIVRPVTHIKSYNEFYIMVRKRG